MLLNMQRKMAANGMDPKKAAEMLAGIKENFRPEAERSVKLSFLLEAIARKESISAGDEDIQERLRNIASRYGQSYENVKKTYQESQVMEDLKSEVADQKTLDFIEERAKITVVENAEKGS